MIRRVGIKIRTETCFFGHLSVPVPLFLWSDLILNHKAVDETEHEE
jgi:hypothetical protein